MTFAQKRNDVVLSSENVRNVQTATNDLTSDVERDLLLAAITLKYTQVSILF